LTVEIKPCPNCTSTNLYKTERISAGGGYAPYYLPGLGKFLSSAKFDVVVCADCGLTRFFAREDACMRLKKSTQWRRI